MVDTSLKLGWSSKGFPHDTDYGALSPSSAKLFAEDPHKYYLRKVAKEDEPFSIPLVAGIAAHEGMEAFLTGAYADGHGFDTASRQGLRAAADALAENWDEVADPVVRENPDDLSNPRDRERVELSLDEMEERLGQVLWHSFCSVDEFADVYKVFAAQQQPIRCEASVGELARDHDLPHHTITSYDPRRGEYGDMPVAVIGGVPVRGRIDLVAEWPDGGQIILDHKTVSKVVSYYPPHHGSGPWTMYEPSYDAADALQLDMYAYGAGVPRAGFQFMLRRPQYEPEDRPLYPDWVDEPRWRDHPDLLPAAFVDADDGLRQLCVYRPLPGDAADATDAYSLAGIERRVTVRVRQIAEALTESLILYDDGVEPDIAFPAGDPDEIGRKACPYCHFGPAETGMCMDPRDVSSTSAAEASRRRYENALAAREDCCQGHARIQRLRDKWAHETEYQYPHLFDT